MEEDGRDIAARHDRLSVVVQPLFSNNKGVK
jgi:hypothetical protein